MSTTGVSTRSSRLNSGKPSTRADSRVVSEVSTRSSRLNSGKSSTRADSRVVSRKNLKSKNTITTTKSLQKIDINTKDKNLNVSETNVSINNSQPLSKRLRPRRNKKDYCEDSKLLKRYIPQNHQNSVVILEDNLRDKKVPIYKAMKSVEKSLENKNDVYDFMFDNNDTIEKAPKKRQKKKISKKKDKITKKTQSKKVTIQSKIIDTEGGKFHGLDTNSSANHMQNNPLKESVKKLTAAKSTKKDKKKIEAPKLNADIQVIEKLKDDTLSGEKIASPYVDTDIQMVQKSVEEGTEITTETPRINTEIVVESIYPTENLSDTVFPKQIKAQDTKKPKILSVENADNIVVIKSPPKNTEEIWPFRPKNIFDNETSIKRRKNTLNCTLLTESLSPIVKTTNILDLGSPWRPPTSTFSQAKYFTQSTPKLRFESKKNLQMNKENMEISKENMKINNEKIEVDKENIKANKENMEMNKKNKSGKEKGRKKKIIFYKEDNLIQKKLPICQSPEKVQKIDTIKNVAQAAPVRISLGEIKNLLQTKPDNNDDNRQATEQVHVEVDKSSTKQKEKVINFLNFSDTFDILSETERQSSSKTEVNLFMDEPSHFSKPPRHSYGRKRTVKFDFEENSEEEEEEKEENVKHHTKKKKLTKSKDENEKRTSEWIKTINSTFEEIEKYNLLIE